MLRSLPAYTSCFSQVSTLVISAGGRARAMGAYDDSTNSDTCSTFGGRIYPVSGSSNFLAGGTLVAIAVANLDIHLTWWWIASFAGSVLISMIILLSLSYLFSAAAFYAPAQAEEISSYVLDSTGELSKYPLSGMGLAIQIPLLTLFPAGLLGWFPSQALLGKPPLGLTPLYPCLVAGLLFFITKQVFMKGLDHYVKAGTNRYSSVGHRR